MTFIKYFWMIEVVSFLLLLSSCKQPIQPETPLNFDEPDTIKSYVSFTITAPLRQAYKWELRTPADTFSKGAVTSTGVITRTNVWLVGGASFGHSLKSRYCSFKCSQSFDLVTRDFVRPNDGVLDALRSSQIESIQFLFDVQNVMRLSKI
jgi:hypothetical protein